MIHIRRILGLRPAVRTLFVLFCLGEIRKACECEIVLTVPADPCFDCSRDVIAQIDSSQKQRLTLQNSLRTTMVIIGDSP
jgi:hypothetical protein